MADPLPRSALAEIRSEGRSGATDRGPGIELAERSALGMLQITAFAGGAEQAAAAVAAELGLALPREPDRAATRGDVSAFATGPGRWLLVAPASGRNLEALLAARLDGAAGVVELGHGRCVIRIAGPASRELLAKGCSLDLHPRAFPAGAFAQTSLARLAVLLHAVGASVFDVYVARSYAVHFWEWLTHAAAEFGYTVRGEAAPLSREEGGNVTERSAPIPSPVGR